MIQRVQSVYLLVAVLMMVWTMFAPLGSYGDSSAIYYALGIESVSSSQMNQAGWGVFAIACLSAIVALATIFVYKNRKLQIRLGIFNILILVGWYAVYGAFAIAYGKQLEQDYQLAYGMFLPLVAIVLSVLAVGAIRHDERLVRAADRLR